VLRVKLGSRVSKRLKAAAILVAVASMEMGVMKKTGRDGLVAVGFGWVMEWVLVGR